MVADEYQRPTEIGVSQMGHGDEYMSFHGSHV
jgi:hypothetical protein